jgi:hypothetical protein
MNDEELKTWLEASLVSRARNVADFNQMEPLLVLANAEWRESQCTDFCLFKGHSAAASIRRLFPDAVVGAEQILGRRPEIVVIDPSNALLPTAAESHWVRYSDYLRKNQKWSNADLDALGQNCLSIFQCLKIKTDPAKPIKGLVIGSVQSGKTANMAGTMAIAADYGFNVFMVLTGTLENLRKQTQARLEHDLGTQCDWKVKGHNESINDVNLVSRTSPPVVFTALKNPTRIRHVLNQMAQSSDREHIKLLIIDDESDHAGINTKKAADQRTAANNAMIHLINAQILRPKNHGAIPSPRPPIPLASVNYIGYTATPQAQLLATKEDLFPNDFIALIENPAAYFGVLQIMGAIPDAPLGDGSDEPLPAMINIIREGQGGNEVNEGLFDAICWFLVSVSAIRLTKARKAGEPVSMLVHTSARQADHDVLLGSILAFLRGSRKDILRRSEHVWNAQTARLQPASFRTFFEKYPQSYHIPASYPAFASLRQGVSELIDAVGARTFNDDSDEALASEGDDASLTIALDNSSKAIPDSSGHGNVIGRLVYPSDEKKQELNKRGIIPAYIVVGGNTLSRGLTIEGLVSTYFARNVKSADELMQMGRWFGYRRGYELYPRIWLTEQGNCQMQELARWEEGLHETMRSYARGSRTPREVAPVLKAGMFRNLRITSPAKMRGASELSEAHFAQYNYVWKEQEIQKNNDIIRNLVSSIQQNGGFAKSDWVAGCSYATDVDWHLIRTALEAYVTPLSEHRPSLEVAGLATKEGANLRWRVILAGLGENLAGTLDFNGLKVNAVRRASSRFGERFAINKSFEDTNMSNSDIPGVFTAEILKSRGSAASIASARKNAGIDQMPILAVYVLSKDIAKNQDGSWSNLLPVESVAISIRIPGNYKWYSVAALPE